MPGGLSRAAYDHRMCGRYVSPDEASIEREFNLVRTEWRFPANFNIAPSQPVPAIRARGAGREGVLLRWGLVPLFAAERSGKYSTFNARSETLASSAIFGGPWKRGQRCIIPALGFYDWHVNADGTKQPFYIRLDDQTIFGFAGLWEGESCTIITMPANTLMASIHNSRARMPAILSRDMREPWLFGSPEAARAALVAYADEQMIAYPVDPRVNSARNNDETLLDPVETDVD
jgi:putative SOS response-associated peptidase YedK